MTTTLDGHAIDAVAALAEKAATAAERETQIAGRHYSTIELKRVDVDPERPEPMQFLTLDGFVGFVKSEPAIKGDEAVVHVVSPMRVDVVSLLWGDDNHLRTHFASAFFKPEMHGFEFNRLGSLESIAIALQTCFHPGLGDVTQLQAFVASVRATQSVGVADDGVSQTVEARSGIAAVQTTPVKPLWALGAYRTFAEIEPPLTDYVLRFKKQEGELPSAGLFETGSGEWALDAVARIAKYLRDKLMSGWTVLG